MKKFLVFLFIGSIAGSCKKPRIPNGNIMPPAANLALLDKQGNSLLTSTSTPINVWFIQDGQRKYLGAECAGGGCTMVREAHSSTGTPKYPFYYGSLGMSEVSAGGYKTFYLELGGKTDTLFWDVQKTKPNDPLDKYDVLSAKFNGKPVTIDQDQIPIYPLQRLH